MRFNVEKLMLFYPNTLLSEFYSMFGAANAEKLLQVFAGTTIQIPSTVRVSEAMRDITIYETLIQSKSAPESRRLGVALAKQYEIDRKDVRKIFHAMRKRVAFNRRLRLADHNVSRHIPKGKIKQKRRTRWTL